jgi:hypothetical protein
VTNDEVLVLAYTGLEPAKPECRGFAWIGQHFTSCDECGRPIWEHEGIQRHRPGASLGAKDSFIVEPFEPGEREKLRRRFGQG